MPVLFKSPYGLQFSPVQVVDEVIRYMDAEPKRQYKIMIGTDSERLPNNEADFVTAIAIHRVGNGGRYFWRDVHGTKFFTLRDRIIKEVLMSIDIAQEILTTLQERSPKGGVHNWEFEIHADVGENGPTKSMIQEIVGMIRAHNFEVKTKPGSYAASNVADRYC
ncbi:MAG: ribonuclease H-like YkuK family protein [bacterium]|nr:ribonuclease H-like YkuK family protein [bacterium]